MAGLGLPGREKVVSGLPREGKRQFWGSWEGKRAVSGVPGRKKVVSGAPGEGKGRFRGSPGRKRAVSGLPKEKGSFRAAQGGKREVLGAPRGGKRWFQGSWGGKMVVLRLLGRENGSFRAPPRQMRRWGDVPPLRPSPFSPPVPISGEKVPVRAYGQAIMGKKRQFQGPPPTHPPPRAAFKGFVSPLQGNLGGLGSPFPAFPAALSPLFLFWGHFQVYGAK